MYTIGCKNRILMSIIYEEYKFWRLNMKGITHQELYKSLSKLENISQEKAKKIMNTLLDILKENIENGNIEKLLKYNDAMPIIGMLYSLSLLPNDCDLAFKISNNSLIQASILNKNNLYPNERLNNLINLNKLINNLSSDVELHIHLLDFLRQLRILSVLSLQRFFVTLFTLNSPT